MLLFISIARVTNAPNFQKGSSPSPFKPFQSKIKCILQNMTKLPLQLISLCKIV